MSPIDREEAARRAAEELLKPEFEKESLLALIWRRINQFLGDLMDAATGGGPAGGIIAGVMIVLIILGVIVLISWQLRRTARRNALAVGGLFGQRAMSAAEHRQAAERLAAEGRWSEAIQERLRAIARDLEERALVDGMPGRTADELAAEAAVALPGFATELAAAARAFDDVTYGGVPGTRETYDSMTHLDDRLRQARPVPLAAPAGVGAGVPVGAGAPTAGPAGGPVAGRPGGPIGGPMAGPPGGPSAYPLAPPPAGPAYPAAPPPTGPAHPVAPPPAGLVSERPAAPVSPCGADSALSDDAPGRADDPRSGGVSGSAGGREAGSTRDGEGTDGVDRESGEGAS
ncbi:DUF4129 domain-containing protein [Nonomuraea sp. SYSU D8015]|uniref:DUF4129 domain-containing protein n=1 Tax=Nonomuraea sp. SYSU D8015 TaxID=2593644 RepID=UPI001660C23A|nr:DUF4129 domain-containing protein [Nonomuraea sp. SYSU D8015]